MRSTGCAAFAARELACHWGDVRGVWVVANGNLVGPRQRPIYQFADELTTTTRITRTVGNPPYAGLMLWF
jgi:hypothetical protein